MRRHRDITHQWTMFLPLSLMLIMGIATAHAEGWHPAENLHYSKEVQATVAHGDHTPLWLTANKYGLSSLETWNGYVRASIQRPLSTDSGRHFGLGYGADLVLADGFTSRFVLHQAYADVRWLHGVLTIGAKEQPMQLKDQELSSGSQALGINARPVPQVRLSLPEYWTVPGTRNWIALKGHIAFGRTTDDRWQRDFTQQQHTHTKGTWLHTKAGYLRIGPKNITFEGGLEMATQFGGSTWQWDEDTGWNWYENEKGLSGLVDAIIPGGGSDLTDGSYQNSGGNHLGAWLARLTFDLQDCKLSLYGEHFFEDQSSMLQTGAYGYGTGQDWNVRKKNSIFLYDMKDFMVGAEVQLKKVSFLNKMVVEYLTTRYQSGSVYHDHTQGNNIQITGRDNYYNHVIFSGWQHWGMVMGNSLYLSPLYNDDGWLEVRNNRFRALHLGLSGDPSRQFHYRLLATWQRGWGAYDWLYPDPKNNFSLLAETSYNFAHHSPLHYWKVNLGIAVDRGKIYGNNIGLQLSIRYCGVI